jgi:tyrosine-protein kinase Etk/Wzc
MNAPHPLQPQFGNAVPAAMIEDEDQIDLREYWDIILDNRWLIAAITGLAIAVGTAYALLSRPIYEANLLVQVEDSSSARSLLGDAATLFDVKTPASAEIEILRPPLWCMLPRLPR